MQDTTNLPRTKCATCGTIIPRRDVRDKKTPYCSQKCGSAARFSQRYRGSQSGPMDRPVNIASKMKWQPGDSSDIQEPNLA